MKKMVLGAAVAMAAVASFGAHEVSTTTALVEAITAINNGDKDNTIRLAAGTYDVSGCNMSAMACLCVSNAVVIEGTDTTSWRDTDDWNTKTILDAKEAKAVIELGSVSHPNATFRHLTILNGKTTGNGAGIRNGWYNGQYAVCTNCVFRNNTAEGQGGGGHTLTIRDCYFTNNVATEGGAVLQCSGVTNCRFEYNRAKTNGGALRNGGTMSGCVFVGNVGKQNSCNYGGGFTVTDCTCISNSAETRGCFSTEAASKVLTVKNSVFIGNRNTTGNGGGALWTPRLVTNCVFVGNYVPNVSGGAIYTETNATVIVDCAFTNNVSASVAGGGGAINGFDAVNRANVIHCDFYGNSTTNVGGAVRYASVTNCTFANCRASSGGAAALSKLVDCTIVDCHGTTSGGAAFESSLADCVVSNCTCGTFGKAAAVDGTTQTAERVTFVDCHLADSNSVTRSANGMHFTDCEFVRCCAGAIKSATRCRIVGNGMYDKGNKMSGGWYTNCLVTCVSADYVFEVANFVNCTIVSNGHGRAGQIFAGTTKAWNCIFLDNYHNNGNHFDVAGYGNWYFTNCVFKTHPNWSDYTFHNAGTLALTKAQVFMKPTSRYFDPANPYKVAKTSLARNASTADGVVWPDGATDLLGQPRLTEDGKSDIGCYQSWFPQFGMLLFLR